MSTSVRPKIGPKSLFHTAYFKQLSHAYLQPVLSAHRPSHEVIAEAAKVEAPLAVDGLVRTALLRRLFSAWRCIQYARKRDSSEGNIVNWNGISCYLLNAYETEK